MTVFKGGKVDVVGLKFNGGGESYHREGRLSNHD